MLMDFAKHHNFDPLVATNWNAFTKVHLYEFKVRKRGRGRGRIGRVVGGEGEYELIDTCRATRT